MSNFEKVFESTMEDEGEFSNHPDDKGDQTFFGISRKYWPGWPGWPFIDDALKYRTPIPQNNLRSFVRDFYYTEYWLPLAGDSIVEASSLSIAEFLFSWSVNKSRKRAILDLQRALNKLNRNQKLYKNIRTDGVFGPVTLNTLKVCWQTESNHLPCLILLFHFRNEHYISRMDDDESQEAFVGWFTRSIPPKLKDHLKSILQL